MLLSVSIVSLKCCSVGCFCKAAFTRWLLGNAYAHNKYKPKNRWMAEGALHASIVTFLPMAALGAGAVLPEGRRVGLWGYGLVVYTCVVLVANGRVAMENKMWTAVFASVFVLSLVVYVLVWFFFSEM